MATIAMIVQTIAIRITSTKPMTPDSANGKVTLVPQREKIIVGTDKIMVKAAKSFITSFRLLEITDVNAFIMFMRILVYISTISIACLFSMITSSKRSSSSSYILRR